MIMYDLDKNQAGLEFCHWPLHITIVFYFTYDGEIEDRVLGLVSRSFQEIGPISVAIGRPEMYGRDKNVAVTEIVDKNGKLAALNKLLVKRLQEIGCRLIDLTYMLDNYSPHVSDQNGRKCPRVPIVIDNLSVVKKIDKDNKVIYKKYGLKNDN